MKSGNIFIITGSTCAGKTIISEMILKQRPNTIRAISVTVRPPRLGEINGKHYFFVSKEEFEDMIINNNFIEWCIVHGEYYGTSVDSFTKTQEGIDVIKVIDPYGALKLKKALPNAIFFFFAPRNFDIVKSRISSERSDKNNDIRLENYNEVMKLKKYFDFYIDTSGDSSENSINGCLNKILEIMNSYTAI